MHGSAKWAEAALARRWEKTRKANTHSDAAHLLRERHGLELRQVITARLIYRVIYYSLMAGCHDLGE